MSGLLGHREISVDTQKANDIHRAWVVVFTLCTLVFFAYLYTDLAKVVGISTPQQVANSLAGACSSESAPCPTIRSLAREPGVFDQSGELRSNLYLPGVGPTGTYQHSYPPPRHDLLVLFAIWALAFLLSYFLPLVHKTTALVICGFTALFWLVGLGPSAGFIAAHIFQYGLYHPKAKGSRVIAALPGLLTVVALRPDHWSITQGLLAIAASLVSAGIYSFALRPVLLRLTAVARGVRLVASQVAILSLMVGVSVSVFRGSAVILPFALLLFFFHWHRCILYHIDHTDHRIPEDLPVLSYLAVFFNPATLAGFAWSPYIGQGYAYTTNALLRRDKNQIVLSGVAFIGTALVFLLAHRLLSGLVDRNGAMLFGQVVHIRIEPLLKAYASGTPVGTISVLLTSLLYVVGWMCMWASVTRLKIGLWKLFGYDFDPHFNQPWKATNLNIFWSRFAFHYREFLVKGFYYPVLFRFKWAQRIPKFRKFAAIMAAATVGNMVWGHGIEELYYSGLTLRSLVDFLPTWPYYLLLGLGIAATDFYLRKRKRRRTPWTLDRRLILDVVAAYATAQYFALIHVFAYQSQDTSLSDQLRLFFLGLGIPL